MATTNTTESYKLPPPTLLPSLPESELNEVISHLFEPSPTLLSLISDSSSSSSSTTSAATPQTYPEWINSIHHLLLSLNTPSSSPSSSDQQKLLEILGSHPRLGATKVDSAHSRSEQASLAAGAEEEAEMLRALNQVYEETFPGLRYVVFVNARPRSTIMADMRQRIDRDDFEAEKVAAIEAMCDIAKDRATKLSKSEVLE